MWEESTLDAAVDLYGAYLRKYYPNLSKPYYDRNKAAPESGRAEAALFAFLQAHCNRVEPHETRGTGGPDFLCTTNGNRFLVEVTALEEESVVRASDWNNDIPDNGETFDFNFCTAKIRQKASDKAPQFKNSPMPRILAIATSHPGCDVLFGRHAAQAALLSDTLLSVPINSPTECFSQVTHLQESVFIRPKNGAIEPCRQSISALLLAALLNDHCSVFGVLHPAPAKRFDIAGLPTVPFVRLTKWPPEGNQLSVEWIVSSPQPAKHQFRKLDFQRAEELFDVKSLQDNRAK
ncbi:MAG: hypothetical protein HY696_05990 [Deltaproteobacteria bacterium]|nr:hypothetical protein [Deltaproteobacteria bacterium]